MIDYHSLHRKVMLNLDDYHVTLFVTTNTDSEVCGPNFWCTIMPIPNSLYTREANLEIPLERCVKNIARGYPS